MVLLGYFHQQQVTFEIMLFVSAQIWYLYITSQLQYYNVLSYICRVIVILLLDYVIAVLGTMEEHAKEVRLLL